MYELFLFDLGIAMLLATVLAYILRVFKQPPIVAYILAGILMGPDVFGIIKNEELIKTLAELGIAFLLFIVGMELDVGRLKRVGSVVMFVGITEIIAVTLVGYFVMRYLGFGFTESIYVGAILALSSTMIVVKMMSETNQLSTLHGRIILGVLLLQDIIAVVILATITSYSGMNGHYLITPVVSALGLFSLAMVTGRYITPYIVKRISKDPEILFLTSLSTLFMFSLFAYLMGLPISVGSFLAGIALAVFPYNVEMISRIVSLRDFFSAIFMISLGMMLDLTSFRNMLHVIGVFLFIVMIVKPVMIYLLCSLAAHERKVSFFSGTYLGQISEFAFIVISVGLTHNVFNGDISSSVITATLISMSITPALISNGARLFYELESLLVRVDRVLKIRRKHFHDDEIIPKISKLTNHVIICGGDFVGYKLTRKLISHNIPVVVIDFDPEVIEKYRYARIPVIYGDVTHPEVMGFANVKKASVLISTIPMEEDNTFLLTNLRRMAPSVRSIIFATTIDEAIKYYSMGADYVIIPKLVSIEKTFSVIKKALDNDFDGMNRIREAHLRRLEEEKTIELLRPMKEQLMEIKNKVLN